MIHRIARTALLLIITALLAGAAFATRPLGLIATPDYHWPITTTADTADPGLVLVADFNSANDVGITAYAESLGLAVD